MPAGVEETGYSSTRTGNEDSELPLYATGNGGVLSKSSLRVEHPDPNGSVDFLGAVSAACVRSRTSASFAGEPPTPNGAGDCANSYSPHSVPSGRSYSYEQPSMGMRSESSPVRSNLVRRSCSFGSDEPSVYSGHSVLMPAFRGSRFLSATAYNGPGPVSALSETTVLGATPACVETLPGHTNSYVQWLEQELRSQYEENQRLRQKALELEADLSVLRAQLSRLRGGPTQADGALDDQDPHALGPWAQLPAVDCDEAATLYRQRRQAATLNCDEHGVAVMGSQAEDAAPPAAAPSSSSRSLGASAGDMQPGGRAPDSALVRLDTPPHTHEAMAPVQSLSVDLDEATSLAGRAQQLHQTPEPAACSAPTAVLAPLDGPDSGGHPARASRASGKGLRDPAEAAAEGVATPISFPGLHALLAAERRRTDRAHAALLFSSRQAQLLKEKLAEMQFRSDQLEVELRDWRRFCLANHRELMKYRKATGAGAERLFK